MENYLIRTQTLSNDVKLFFSRDPAEFVVLQKINVYSIRKN